jgi:peptidyl-tRNA hydrolase
LSAGLFAAQLCHALRQFSNDYPEIDKNWFINSNYICLLSVNSEAELFNLCKKCDELNLCYSKFFEPDLNNSLTAICLAPGKLSKKLVSKLKLALS